MARLFTKLVIAHNQLLQSSFGRKRHWLLLLFLLPMLACGLPSVATQPAFHPTGQIVFECWPDRTSSRLCLVNADGTGYRQLTNKTTDRDPAWAPDGKHIVFTRRIYANDSTALFVMNLDGSGLMQLTDASFSSSASSWHPSENKIAFTYSEKERGLLGIAFISPEGGEVTFLTNSSEVEPRWSPDGTQIAYIQNIYTYGRSNEFLYIMNADGSNRTQLTSIHSASPSWSPDGTKIAFTCGVICIINPDGSDLLVLEEQGLSPSWSPDGQYIVFRKSDPACILCPNSGQLWVMRADGSQATKITDGPVDQNPVWEPLP